MTPPTPKPGSMVEIAERVERGETTRELEAAIAVAANAVPYDFEPAFMMGEWRAIYDNRFWSAPAYLTSIDAAMTLVPERWGNVGTYPWVAKQKPDLWQAGVSAPGNEKRPPVCCAATPALALTAAALRAIAALDPVS